MGVKKLDYEGLETLVTATKYYIKKHAGMPIGHEYFSTNPNIPDGSLPLLGGGYLREQYKDLWAWVQTQTGYLITESAWQSLYNSQNGNVPFYSDGDGSTTFRVPSLKCWIKGKDGTETVGTYKQAGLPNITGEFLWREAAGESPLQGFNGAFSSDGYVGTKTMTLMANSSLDNYKLKNAKINASRSSAIYGRSSTVVPESIVGLWLVRAYGAIIDDGIIEVKEYIDEQITRKSAEMLIGSIQAFAGNSLPTGWLLCDGSAINRVTYAGLFEVIGTTYGLGDNITTFNLPNLTDKFIQGNATAGSVKSAGLPNIRTTGVGSNNIMAVKQMGGAETWSGPLGVGNSYSNSVGSGGTTICAMYLQFNASYSNSIYGNSSTVQPPALTMRYIIKY